MSEALPVLINKGGITLKNNTPQIGPEFGSQGFVLNEGKIGFSNRAVTNANNVDFVVTNEGKLILGSGHYNLSGEAQSVKAAGQMSIYKGKVTNVNNSSGHYKPTIEEASDYLNTLKNAGVDVSKTKLNLYNTQGVKVKTITRE